jgi:hypothetical protein
VEEELKNTIDSSRISVIDESYKNYQIDYFNANIGFGLKIASIFDIPSDLAIKAMKECVKDIGVLSLHRYKDSIFVNGFSINDIDSTLKVFNRVISNPSLSTHDVTILLNNRLDRGQRAKEYLGLLDKINFNSLVVMGAYYNIFRRKFGSKVTKFESLESIKGSLIFGMGNIKGKPYKIMELLEKGCEKIWLEN